MRELDTAMLSYLDVCYDTATEAERDAFEALLNWQEPELYRLICGKDKDARYQNIIDKITAAMARGNRSV